MIEFGPHAENPKSNTIEGSRMTHVLHVTNQEPSKSFQVTDDDGEVLDRLLIMPDSKFGTNICRHITDRQITIRSMDQRTSKVALHSRS